MADTAQPLFFHMRYIAESISSILKMRSKFINKFVGDNFLHFLLCIEHSTKSTHDLIVVFRGHFNYLLLGADLPKLCFALGFDGFNVVEEYVFIFVDNEVNYYF
jgi:hypothetical protein